MGGPAGGVSGKNDKRLKEERNAKRKLGVEVIRRRAQPGKARAAFVFWHTLIAIHVREFAWALAPKRSFIIYRNL